MISRSAFFIIFFGNKIKNKNACFSFKIVILKNNLIYFLKILKAKYMLKLAIVHAIFSYLFKQSGNFQNEIKIDPSNAIGLANMIFIRVEKYRIYI
ncbi:hypothetical protein EGI16_11495 [Chryseobacterium sp. G0240]|nr:hypothetical protein EGI16_11495 [Chryseobacterium sp. G0240]